MLRDYQLGALGQIAAEARSSSRILVQAPTGAGKTHIIAGLVACANRASLSVLILATRTRLIRQIHERLDAFGIRHGVIAAALSGFSDRGQRVQIASADTLYRRAIVRKSTPLPSADVVIFDEAHLALGASRTAILEQYPEALLVGFTATPAKVSGRPLGEQFGALIMGPSMRELISRGLLVKPRIFSKPVVEADELSAVSRDSKTNDYVIGELGELMSKAKLVGDVVQNWLRIAHGKRTIVFACNKSHGAHLVEQFRQEGVAAELLTDQDEEEAREAALARLERAETSVVVNCFLLSYGVDLPAVECIVLARPTRSVVLYLQAVGRGMRPAPGKDSVTVIDHGRVVENLGLPTEDFRWSLRSGSNVNSRDRQRGKWNQGIEKPRTCPECSYTWLVSEDGLACSSCGWAPAPRAKPVRVQDAELAELDASRPFTGGALRPEAMQFFQEAIGWYARRWPDRWLAREKSGRWWAWQKTREHFRFQVEKPPVAYWSLPELAPSDMTAGYLKSRMIAWARRGQAA